MARVFAYGSLLNPRELLREGVDPGGCRPARVSGYRLAFDKRSRRRCAAANLEPCNGCTVAGIVCEADSRALERLDEREVAYQRVLVYASPLGGGEALEAHAYMSSERLDASGLERCLGDGRLQEYLRVIAWGLAHWERVASGFARLYLSSIRRDRVHERILGELERLLEAAYTAPGAPAPR